MDTAQLTSQYNFFHFSQETSMILKEMHRMNDRIAAEKRAWEMSRCRESESLDKSFQSLSLDHIGHSPVRNVILRELPPPHRSNMPIAHEPTRRQSRLNSIERQLPPTPTFQNPPPIVVPTYQNSYVSIKRVPSQQLPTYQQRQSSSYHGYSPSSYGPSSYGGHSNSNKSCEQNELSVNSRTDHSNHWHKVMTNTHEPAALRQLFAMPTTAPRRLNRNDSAEHPPPPTSNYQHQQPPTRSFQNSYFYPKYKYCSQRGHNSQPGYSSTGSFGSSYGYTNRNRNYGQGQGSSRQEGIPNSRTLSSNNYRE